MHLFYTTLIEGSAAILSAEESQHCVRVLRLTTGELVNLIDGKGNLYEARITFPDSKKCKLEVISVHAIGPSPKPKIHIAIAPTKNMDRFEWFLEKAVEIGVDWVTPLLCDRSERKVLKTDRLQKLIISTMKQAMIYHTPVLQELTNFSSFVNSCGTNDNLLIAHCIKSERKSMKEAIVPSRNVIVLIGPEGDFTPEEVESAIHLGFVPITLGNNRLRTETAGIVACLTAHLML